MSTSNLTTTWYLIILIRAMPAKSHSPVCFSSCHILTFLFKVLQPCRTCHHLTSLAYLYTCFY